MHEKDSLSVIQKEWHGTFKSYLIGLVISLLLTGVAFYLAIEHFFTGQFLVYTLVGMALLQAIAQLLFFLHLGKEESPRWETIVFLFMVMVLLIIAIGSLWIMHDLNHRVMSDMMKGGG